MRKKTSLFCCWFILLLLRDDALVLQRGSIGRFTAGIFLPASIPAKGAVNATSKGKVNTTRFSRNTKLSLPFDSTLISSGHLVVDNGIIEVPESPATQGYMPTSIKDFKQAAPSERIDFIAPPVANSQGSANLSFDIHLPSGRKGMEPDLKVKYDNQGGSGWLGLGWDLTVPSVSIDTRWGVPRYDPVSETETYILNDEQLAPNTRDIMPPRVAEKQFHPRVEKKFDRIIRHGSSPANYWWEVTNKNGNRNFYGGEPATGVTDSAVLKDDQGNIAHWALVKTEDPDGNTIHYVYTTISDPGIPDLNALPGRQLYINRIFYTGLPDTDGPYEIDFTRDRQLNELLRKDVNIDCRLGFKMVTADLLRDITVRFNNQVIRSYSFNYKQGAFYKTLLDSLSELDGSELVFYSHHFDYYDDVHAAKGYLPLGTQKNWVVPNDGIKGDIITNLPGFTGGSSAIQTEKSGSVGGGFAGTIGFIGDGWSKSGTIGGSFSYDNSSNEGLVILKDMNGDGLPDKVFRSGNAIFYRPNLGSSMQFGDPVPLTNIDGSAIGSFNSSNAQTFSGGLQIIPGGLTFFGYNYSSSTATTSIYLNDFNEDGLTDIASGGNVYFNSLAANGNPVFATASTYTPNPILPAGNVDRKLLAPDTALQKRQENMFPLQDIIRFWEVPFTGIVSVKGPVAKLPVADSLRSAKEDGLRVSIQVLGNVLWNSSIPAGDNTARDPANVDHISVNKGDRIYFRVQSVYNGQNDIVQWDPVIDYTAFDSVNYPLINSSNQSSIHYQASRDFILTGNQPVGIAKTGTFTLQGQLTKGKTSDSIMLFVSRKNTAGQTDTILSRGFSGEIVVNASVDTAIQVAKGDVLYFSVHADSYVDRHAVQWLPQYQLTYLDSVSNSTASLSGTVVPDNDGLSDWLAAAPLFVPQTNDTLIFVPAIHLTGSQSGRLVFSIKRGDSLLGKTALRLVNGQAVNHPDSIHLILQSGKPLFFEYNVTDRNLALALAQSAVTGMKDTMVHQLDTSVISRDSIEAGKHVIVKDTLYRDTVVKKTLSYTYRTSIYTNTDSGTVSPVGRGWGQFSFIGDPANGPLNESNINYNEFRDSAQYSTPFTDTARYRQDSGRSTVSVKNPAQTNFIPVYASARQKAWVGRDSSVYVSDSIMSSSRLWMHDVSVDSLMKGASLSAVNLIEQTTTNTYCGGLGGAGNINFSSAGTTTQLDMMDMNGDGFPDILHQDDIQYTLPGGGLETVSRSHGLGGAQNQGASYGFNLGGNYNGANPNSSVPATARNEHNTAGASSGLSGDINFNNSQTTGSWIDINGDGLPDKVYNDGTVLLNLGYAFEKSTERWYFGNIDQNTATSTELGAGGAFDIEDGTIEGGVGLSHTASNNQVQLIDINGDGLPDALSLGNDSSLIVRLNTGNGFGPPIPWKGAGNIGVNVSGGESFNVAFTVAIDIPIPFFPIKICLNPSFYAGHGVSSQQDQIMDIDGDGYPDFLHSENDGNLSVRSSTIGRTNMLRTVSRPMGSYFVLDYEKQGNTYAMPGSIWVLKSRMLYDGVGGEGADTMRSRFVYSGPLYNRRERLFYGYDTVITQDLNTAANNVLYRSAIQVFSNDNFYDKGLLTSEWVQDAAGNLFTQTNTIYQLRRIIDSVVFPALTETDKLYFEGQPTAGASTSVLYDYDTLGNIISINDKGDGSPQDRLMAAVTYHDIDRFYIKDEPATIELSTYQGIRRKRTAEIDGLGHVTRISQFLGDGRAAVSDMSYDVYGNLTSIIRPANYKGERLSYQYGYDNVVHTYTTSVKDAYGYKDSTVYEFLFGNPVRILSLNNEPENFVYDNRGRLVSFSGPYEIASGKPYTIAFEYHPEASVPYAISRHYDPEYNEDIRIISFMDGLGRTIQIKKDGALFAGKNKNDTSLLIISGRNVYDAMDRISQSYYPATDAVGPGDYELSRLTQAVNETNKYDVVDRPVATRLADGATDSMFYVASNNLLGSLMTDANGNRTDKWMDVRERLRTTHQYGGPAGVITTQFMYDALDELTGIVDTKGDSLVNTYDNLGRKTAMQHPDAGLITYGFDLAGNLLQKVTPAIRKLVPDSGAIKYQYDHERVIGIDYPIQYQNKVTYAYGAPGSGDRAGRITLQEDASGGREFFYGRLGEITKEIRTVLVNSVFFTTYVSEQQYDTWNRIKTMTYPDGEAVTYHYNRGGGLLSVAGQKLGNTYYYASQLGYDKFEERVYLRYGNGTEMHYAFDPLRRRLSSLQAMTASGRSLMNNSYSYDPVSNIKGIINQSTAQSGKLGGPANQQFNYDNLYRLTSAAGSYQGYKDTVNYALEMGYDNLFNIVNKNLANKAPPGNYQHAYSYNGASPHQATQIGQSKNSYDPNGNLSVAGNTEYYWDEENRLMALIDSGTLNEYTYDADDERVIKSSGGLQGVWLNGAPAGTVNHFDNYTVYVSPYLVCRKASFTKHIYAEDERIATKIGNGSFANISFPDAALTAGGINYIDRAKQLQQSRISYYASLGISPGPPTDKLFYAEPQNSGIAAPVLVDSTASSVPYGWPADTTGPANGGPPVYVRPIPSRDSVKAGYGYTGTGNNYESNQYFYHADYLGSTAYVSDQTGEASQHVEYIPSGETFLEEHSSSYTSPYLFNAKERDDETKLYYYGARYYNPITAGWISVDPIIQTDFDSTAYDSRSLSVYAYCYQNPVINIDPDGFGNRQKRPGHYDLKSGDIKFTNRKLRKFRITNFSNYPHIANQKTLTGQPAALPTGELTMLEGAPYELARNAANATNARLHRTGLYRGKDLHELRPVKFGGSPTDKANKVALDRKAHSRFTTFFNKLRNLVKRETKNK